MWLYNVFIIRINRDDDIINSLYTFQFVTENENEFFDEVITFDDIIIHALERGFGGNSTEMLWFYLFTNLGLSLYPTKYIQ